MDFTFTPKTTLKGKSFVKYNLPAKELIAGIPVINSGFYYIGKNHTNIEKLVKLFKRGYASDSIENASSELRRSIDQEKNILPEVIFCESSFDFTVVKSLVKFLKSNPLFASVPFILDSANLCEMEMGLYKKHMLTDDIMHIEGVEQNILMSKVRFLNKVKSKATEMKTSLRDDEAEVVSVSNVHNLLKRSFDIVVSLTALLLLLPFFLVIALAIRIESREPVFYISKRAGRGYKIFNFYKFRTMYSGADKRIQELSHLNQYADSEQRSPHFLRLLTIPELPK